MGMAALFMARCALLTPEECGRMSDNLSPAQISEIIEMALSDHVSFATIKQQHGLSADEVKALMRANLKPGSFRAWRKRVRDFGDRREHYK
jgi:uncharacterized protein (TIGR03643 family)